MTKHDDVAAEETMGPVWSRFPPAVVEAVDAWAAKQPARTTRSAAILALTVAGLGVMGESKAGKGKR